MNVIKTEPEIDPLAAQASDDGDLGPIARTNRTDPSHAVKLETEVEESEPIPFTYHEVKCEPEEEIFDVKEETKLEEITEESVIFSKRF
ncbi:uncharacterized protein [Periplaneta americana]|uniref:uncharacterized protein isoform X2 n=1 Tax=Periplaneta americana TaxID=6978 RepID=UPI0037E8A1C6